MNAITQVAWFQLRDPFMQSSYLMAGSFNIFNEFYPCKVQINLYWLHKTLREAFKKEYDSSVLSPKLKIKLSSL